MRHKSKIEYVDSANSFSVKNYFSIDSFFLLSPTHLPYRAEDISPGDMAFLVLNFSTKGFEPH